MNLYHVIVSPVSPSWHLNFCPRFSLSVIVWCRFDVFATPSLCWSGQVLLLMMLVLMNNRTWQILCWNIHGVNAIGKWDVVHSKIDESACSVFCLQETKREQFDMSFVLKFAPRCFDCFDFVPSVGASGGILVGWNSSCFRGQLVDRQQFGITISFSSAHSTEN